MGSVGTSITTVRNTERGRYLTDRVEEAMRDGVSEGKTATEWNDILRQETGYSYAQTERRRRR